MLRNVTLPGARSVLHNGMFAAHAKMTYDQVLFTLPNSNVVIDEMVSKNNGGTTLTALCMDARIFCEKMVAAAHAWHAEMAADSVVAENLPNLIRLRPDGVFPHVDGVPVIA